jgi:hypothetical protein
MEPIRTLTIAAYMMAITSLAMGICRIVVLIYDDKFYGTMAANQLLWTAFDVWLFTICREAYLSRDEDDEY